MTASVEVIREVKIVIKLFLALVINKAVITWYLG